MLASAADDQAINNAPNNPLFLPIRRAGYSAAMRTLALSRLGPRWPDGTALFDDLHLDVGAGLTLLQGDSGSGKSTLLRVIAGELPASGRVTLGGRTREEDPAAWARDVAFVDADDERLDALTPDSVLARLSRRHGAIADTDWQRHVDAFGLRPHLAKAMCQLSAGSRRKVVLAALLAVRPALTLLDEPGAGLDAASLRHLRLALAEANGDPTRAWLLVASFGLDALACNATVVLPSRISA
jgi:ABC-2 type transport system ATP-binding protein